MFFDFSTMSSNQIYFTLTQTVIPRPIAWVLSQNPGGDYNLAPFSFFTPVSSAPPLLMLSLSRKPDGTPKDTLVNIEERKRFVVHIACREQMADVTETSRTLPLGESELGRIDQPLAEFDDFPLPRLERAPVALACELFQVTPIGGEEQTLVFGRILKAYIADHCVDDHGTRVRILASKIDPIGRLGADQYATLGEVLTMVRPR